MTSDPIRAAALKLLRAGEASPSEVAGLAGVTRQVVRYWMMADGVDWRTARDAWLRRRWERYLS